MKKLDDSSYGSKLLRLFRILISDQRRHYLLDLKETLNCSSQTLIRLIEEIESEVGESLEFGKDGRKRWYKMSPLNKDGRLNLDSDDIKFFEICRDLAEPYLPQQVKSRVDKKLWELSLKISEETQNFGEDSNFTFFSKGYIDYSPFFSMITILLDAIKGHNICVVRYRPSGEKDIHRHLFAPCKIACMSGALYVLGSYMESDLKTPRYLTNFAIHRIVSVDKTTFEITFPIPKIESESFGLPWHEPRTFRIKFNPGKSSDYVKERIWAKHQKITEDGEGGIILEIVTSSEPELKAWIRSFGGEAKLLS